MKLQKLPRPTWGVFTSIAKELGISPQAVTARYNRADEKILDLVIVHEKRKAAKRSEVVGRLLKSMQ